MSLSLKVLLCLVVGLLALCSIVDAMCGVCSTNSYAACINETAFKVCFDGETPTDQILSCPANYVCTDEQGVCQERGNTMPSCGSYEKCNYCYGTFACVSQTEFAYCNMNGIQGLIGTCGKGQYCSAAEFLKSSNICALSCLVSPTCSNTEVVTVPPATVDWEATCSSTTKPGYYKNIRDSTCETFVYCEILNNVMNAVFYTCSTGYFDQIAQKCVVTKPTRCT